MTEFKSFAFFGLEALIYPALSELKLSLSTRKRTDNLTFESLFDRYS